MDMNTIREKHQYTVWAKVDHVNAKGLMAKLKEKLIRENQLSSEDTVTFTAYAFQKENILVLAGDQKK
ncbi:hypothetical protein [Paenibacillus silviterrae]|uniref:hypothetical protein n=1 Tax=Paenibacillus silviterrae TaxID=3242194 RepID=UPI002543D6E1|nr:hypothetical protein [Paenibacillus chinjuensis]